MKTTFFKAGIAAVLVLMLSAPAFAGRTYIVGKLGGYTPESSDLSGFSTDFNGELAIGNYLTRNIAVELGVGHLQTSSTFFDPTVGYFDEDIDATYIDGTVKLVFPIEYAGYRRLEEPFMDLYVGGGGGIYFADDNADAIGFHQSDTAGGGHVLGGMDFNLGGGAFLGAETKYIFVQAFQKLPTKLDGFIFTVNLGYKLP
ncbi:MAG: outer membrane beta-barrel protein [Actinomycetota bacterium]|nr:outer membrane beta-barrel protein [Actinomycetota bacterium]